MDSARTTFPELTIQLFKDLRGIFVAVAGIHQHAFRKKMPIPDSKTMRVMFFPSAKYFGYTLMIGNPQFALKEDTA